MSGENERKVHPLRFLLIFLIALGIQILFIRIGVSFRGKIENAEVIYHFSSLLLVLSFVLSAAASFFYTRYIKNRKVRAANEQLDDWLVDWEFSLYVHSPEMEKALNRVSESCIYQKSPN